MSPISQLTIARQLTVTNLGQARRDLHPDRVLDRWVLVLPQRGRIPLQVGDVTFEAGPGEYFLLPPGIRHFGTRRQAYVSNWWHFSAASIGTPCYQLPMYGVAHPTVALAANHPLTISMWQEHRDPWWVEAQLHALLSRLCRDHVHASDERTGRLARELHAWLFAARRRPWEELGVEEHFGYTAGYLNRVFNAAYGRSLRARHLEMRIATAAELLSEGATIAEAAEQTGFSD
jgi:AraC-like DNA-binding protein